MCHRRVSTETTRYKYYAKIENGKSTRYFYSKDEWLAYQKGEAAKKSETEKPKSSALNVIERRRASMASKVAMYLKNTNVESDIPAVKQAIANAMALVYPRSETIKPDVSASEDLADEVVDETVTSTEETPAERPAELLSGPWAEGLKHKDSTMTPDEDQAAINPNYNGEYDDPYTNNCAYCTTAYDLRRRGYDVEALPYDENIQPPTNLEGLSSLYENTTSDDWSKATVLDVAPSAEIDDWRVSNQYRDVIKNLWADSPDGSYGQLSVVWKMGGGHNMVWEKEDGEVTIRDCQTNEVFRLEEKAHEFSYLTNAVYALRTDNREPTKAITNYVRNKEGKNR